MGIIIIEMQDILEDLFKFIKNAVNGKGKDRNKDKLRKTYALEMLHMINTYFEWKRKIIR